MAQVPNALIVNPAKIKASTVAELIAYPKAIRQNHLGDAGQRHDLAPDLRTVPD